MKKFWWGTALGAGALTLATGMFLAGGPADSERIPGSLKRLSLGPGLSAEFSVEPAPLSSSNASDIQSMTALSVARGSYPTTGLQPVISVPAQHVEELNFFQQIKEKVFLTEAEEAEKKKMLRDSSFLRQTGQTLMAVDWMQDPKYTETQNAALDLLLDALQSGDQQVALEVIWSVVKDSQVEDTNLDLKVREALAGTKAELLYHATALAPREFQDLTSQLPGPVSQKIWQNVQKMQSENLIESQRELQAMRGSL
jgi:hypothetical protein